ncbi:MAG: N-acetyl-gamma-glutamyl-phosphate reductase [Pseudomonadaceae bacterium]|nr:N-acetyl-gamma-glutamyl-phosphate reductase [Pseudomonadaceae bacterium]
MSAASDQAPIATVFIDGQAGTTGLDIHALLKDRTDIRLLEIETAERKDPQARARLLNDADIAILCLPDDAARESAQLVTESDTRLLDASTAHRTNSKFAYGLPELNPEQRALIASNRHVSNPGCYPQGFILTVRALLDDNLLQPSARLTVHAISGYSGGGRQMIERYEARDASVDDSLSAQPYALTLSHKHVPEMQQYSGLQHAPVFVPTVCGYYKGMLVHIPLPGVDAARAFDCLGSRYDDEAFIRVNRLDTEKEPFLDPTLNNGSNAMDLLVSGDARNTLVTARYDNLGKGAGGAAVQNLNIMLGLDEAMGLAGSQ